MIEIDVARDDVQAAEAVPCTLSAAEGEVLCEVELFALTANNVTYAVHGTDFRYWDFWPARQHRGIVPVWGFGRVVESRVDGIAVGARHYGYWPMASHALLRAGNVGPRGFDEVSPHRQGLAAVYNRYVPADPAMGSEAVQALFRPLFTTAFSLHAMLAEGPGTLVLASASSKTALGLAQMARAGGQRVVGLTSARNRGFCEATGYFDLVLDYDGLAGLDGEAGPAALVDMAGNGRVRAEVHRVLGVRLVESHVVGDTHWDVLAADLLPGPEPRFFFAPTVIAERVRDWGPAGFEARLAAAWAGFAATLGWLRLEQVSGADAVMAAWAALVRGEVAADVGLVARVPG